MASFPPIPSKLHFVDPRCRGWRLLGQSTRESAVWSGPRIQPHLQPIGCHCGSDVIGTSHYQRSPEKTWSAGNYGKFASFKLHFHGHQIQAACKRIWGKMCCIELPSLPTTVCHEKRSDWNHHETSFQWGNEFRFGKHATIQTPSRQTIVRIGVCTFWL